MYVMLVGAYPFERPEDKHDNQKLQKMIQVSFGGDLLRLGVFVCAALSSAHYDMSEQHVGQQKCCSLVCAAL